ncbi:hypothetical protein BS636_03985 [Acinetobacter sp. LoGeW2-3]|nr:hypothetical protein BS636_03985 [Acinetobacter sp. LoGeW2-3]
MNALEKVHLIKELYELGHDLDHRSLSLYEVARSKKRVQEIFQQCNEPIFKKQLLAFKTRIQPEIAAQEFARETHYYHSYRGFFLNEDNLKEALYAHPLSGWAFLHDPQRGWQIWLIPAPQRTALISEWNFDIEQSFNWLLHQQQLSSCLKSDHELQTAAATLSLEMVEEKLPAPSINTYISKHEIWANTQVLPVQQKFETELQTVTPPAQLDPVNSEPEKPQIENEEIVATSDIPAALEFQNLSFQVSEFSFAEARHHNLFELSLAPESSMQHIKMAWHYQKDIDWTSQPVYLAEQVDRSGRFSHYCMLLGVTEWQQAIQLMQLWGQQENGRIVAIKTMSITELGTNFLQLDSLYQTYSEQARFIWQREDYCPFIPLRQITTQKFIVFDEQEANFNIPLLLLQERQKLRVIHGEQRLKLSSTEQMYPCLILKRDQQINWQLIHQILMDFKEPVAVEGLYAAILDKALDKLM